MWRKTDEAKPSSPASETPAPTPSSPNTASQTSSSKPTSTPSFSPPVSVATSSSGSSIIRGLKLQGEITGTADLYIDGEVQGNIRLGGAKVTVGPNGKVQADIEARAIKVEGNRAGKFASKRGNLFGRAWTRAGKLHSAEIRDRRRGAGKREGGHEATRRIPK